MLLDLVQMEKDCLLQMEKDGIEHAKLIYLHGHSSGKDAMDLSDAIRSICRDTAMGKFPTKRV